MKDKSVLPYGENGLSTETVAERCFEKPRYCVPCMT